MSRASRDNTNETPLIWGPAALDDRRARIRAQQRRVSRLRQKWIDLNFYYYNQLVNLLRFIVEPQKRVLSVRCQTGYVLAGLNPARGVGVEVSQQMVNVAKKRNPQFEFRVSDSETLKVDEKFDYIIFENISDTVDIIQSLKLLTECCERQTRVIISTYNHWWRPLILLAERFRFKVPFLEQNWLSEQDLKNMLRVSGFEWLVTYRIILSPKRIPLVSEFINKFIAPLPLINRLCMVKVIVARLQPPPIDLARVGVSVIVPCRNEEGNIEQAVRRLPEMGRHTEIIFCDDKSSDNTVAEIRRMQHEFPQRDIRVVDGPGINKAKNVWTGFSNATQEVMMILDADLSVMPEELPLFFEALASGKAEFINGSRLVYPLPRLAMKYFNMLGNKVFSVIFSYLLFQPIGDTLCGTKVLWRSDWMRMQNLLGTWGTEDRWGDYELLFGAAKLHLRILDLPVHYQERIFGHTKMVKVFHNGVIMLFMCFHALLKLRLRYLRNDN